MLDPALLQSISPEDITTIPAHTTIQDFHQYIKKVPIVIKGAVKVVSEDAEGREITLYHIKPGESCVASILGALSQGTSSIKAVTIEDTELVMLASTRMYDLIRNNPQWFSFFMRMYQTRFDELLQAVNRSSFSTHEDKVMQLLEQRSQLLDTRVLEVTHKQLAEELGTSREVISRVLKKLETAKKLKMGRGKILLKPKA